VNAGNSGSDGFPTNAGLLANCAGSGGLSFGIDSAAKFGRATDLFARYMRSRAELNLPQFLQRRRESVAAIVSTSESPVIKHSL
jgi:hypothetical protein